MSHTIEPFFNIDLIFLIQLQMLEEVDLLCEEQVNLPLIVVAAEPTLLTRPPSSSTHSAASHSTVESDSADTSRRSGVEDAAHFSFFPLLISFAHSSSSVSSAPPSFICVDCLLLPHSALNSASPLHLTLTLSLSLSQFDSEYREQWTQMREFKY